MEKTKIHRVLMFLLLAMVVAMQMKAQYMPVVFDKSYGTNNKIQLACTLPGEWASAAGGPVCYV